MGFKPLIWIASKMRGDDGWGFNKTQVSHWRFDDLKLMLSRQLSTERQLRVLKYNPILY